jgi:hypothetical protein
MTEHFCSSCGHEAGATGDDRTRPNTAARGPAVEAPHPKGDPGIESIAARWQLAFSGFRPFVG